MKLFVDKNQKYFNIYTCVSSFVIFLVFIIFVLPAESAKSMALGLESSPDTSIFYTAQKLYAIALSYGIEGRRFYINQRFTFDLIWPIAYGAFIFVSSVYFIKKTSLSSPFYKFLWFPIFAVIFDYLENIMTSLVMYRYPNETIMIDTLAGVMTLLKWITLLLAFIFLLTWIFMFLYQKVISSKEKTTTDT